MTTRTFKQYGVAFGSSTANITAKINDVVIYEGPVTTLDESFPSLPDQNYTIDNVLFSWTADVNFSGSQDLEITTDGLLLLGVLNRNYTPILNDVGNIISSGPDQFVSFQSTSFGNTYINESLQSVTHGDLPGMWWWTIPADGTFVENFTVDPGKE